MKMIWIYCKAFLKALYSLMRPLEEVQRVNEEGVKMLKGWEFLPEERLLKDLENAKRKEEVFKMGFLGVNGNHAGEWLGLSSSSPTLIGPSMEAQWVVSSVNETATQHFLFEPRARELFSKDAREFLVNSKKQFRARLLDYDRVEILGNEFLFVEVSS